MGLYEREPEWMIKDYFVKRLDEPLTFGVLQDRPMAEPESEPVVLKRRQQPSDPTMITPQVQQQLQPQTTFQEQINSQLQARMETPMPIPEVPKFVLPRIMPPSIPPMEVREDTHVSDENLQSQQTTLVERGIIVETHETYDESHVSQQAKEPSQEELAAQYQKDVTQLQKMQRDFENGFVGSDELETLTGNFVNRWGRENLPPDPLEKNPQVSEEEKVPSYVDMNMKVTNADVAVRETPKTAPKKTPRYTESYFDYIDPERNKRLKEMYGDSYGI